MSQGILEDNIRDSMYIVTNCLTNFERTALPVPTKMRSNAKKGAPRSLKTPNQEGMASLEEPGNSDGDGELIESQHSSCQSNPSDDEVANDVAKLPPQDDLINGREKLHQIIESLAERDIICGRSKLSHHNEGNRWFRSLIIKYREPYQRAPSRNEKTNITKWILNKIRSDGGRFLIGDGEKVAFKEAGDEFCKEKISHALRSRKQDKEPAPVLLLDPPKKKTPPPSPKPKFNESTMATLFQRQQHLMQSMLHSRVPMLPIPAQSSDTGQGDGIDEGETDQGQQHSSQDNCR